MTKLKEAEKTVEKRASKCQETQLSVVIILKLISCQMFIKLNSTKLDSANDSLFH